MTCPYCGVRRPTYTFRTDAQLAYIRHYVHTLHIALASQPSDGRVAIDMDAVLDSANISLAPNFYYAEVSQQYRFQCRSCKAENDILGHYGYCCCCGARNNMALFEDEVSEIVRVEHKLLAQGKFNDCLFAPAPEEGEDEAEHGSGELQEGLHGDRNPAQCQTSEQDCSCYRVCSILAGRAGAKRWICDG